MQEILNMEFNLKLTELQFALTYYIYAKLLTKEKAKGSQIDD